MTESTATGTSADNISLETERETTAERWSSLGWIKHSDLTEEALTPITVQHGDGWKRHQTILDSNWAFDQLVEDVQSRIDREIEVNYPELLEGELSAS